MAKVNMFLSQDGEDGVVLFYSKSGQLYPVALTEKQAEEVARLLPQAFAVEPMHIIVGNPVANLEDVMDLFRLGGH